MPVYTAVDLGATSGRVVNVRFERDGVDLDVVRRFPTELQPGPGGDLTWNVGRLLADVRAGIAEAVERTDVRSVAIDGWGVDYGLLGEDGRRVGPVHAYRSARTAGIMEATGERVGRDRIYAITGVQFLSINTAYQLIAGRAEADELDAVQLLMVPDLLNHELCGSTTNDVTNASTTQLLDASTHAWSEELVAAFGIRRSLLPALHQPGTRLGELDGVPVIGAASHDTASAVAGTPLDLGRPAMYLSCGTWSLVGCEHSAPVITPEALAANVTNEVGVAGTTRLLKNVTGLWLLEECRRQWLAEGRAEDLATLVEAAAALPAGRAVIDPDDARFAAPGAMVTRIDEACRASGQPVPATPAETARVIFDSLALAWRRTVATVERVSGVEAEVIHLVGGGAANALLADLCASACERPVLVGPTEASVLGNALVQAMADGAVRDLADGRALLAAALPPTVVTPRWVADWPGLAARVDGAGLS